MTSIVCLVDGMIYLPSVNTFGACGDYFNIATSKKFGMIISKFEKKIGKLIILDMKDPRHPQTSSYSFLVFFQVQWLC